VVRVLRAKFHGLRVTGADLHYHGSITLDPEHCKEAGLFPTEFVDVWNKNSGARLTTYVVFGEKGSKCCVLNGAAARTCQEGDELIIAAGCDINENDLYNHKPRILTFTPTNEIDQVLYYNIFKSDDFDYDFRIQFSEALNNSDSPKRNDYESVTVKNYVNVNLENIRRDLEDKGWEMDAINQFISKHMTR
tara:strand:+ start:2457 stop:3029 length:573 start_codon:yes stop_codon:yes gene_type:complete